MIGKAGRICCVLGIVIGAAPGCALTQNGTLSESRYVFQHSMLNFSRVPVFPKRFETPAPMASEEVVVFDDSGVVEEPVQEESSHSYVAGTWREESGETPAEVDTSEAEASVVLEETVSANEKKVESAETDEPIQLAKVSHGGQDELDSILGGQAVHEEPQETQPLSLGDGNDFRLQVRETALTYLGVDGAYDEGAFIGKVLSVNEVESLDPARGNLRDLYKEFRNRGLTYDGEEPSVGDLVFFHNTRDANSDARNNDWYSACGVVTEVSDTGLITFVASIGGQVQELKMNLNRPEVRRDENGSITMNSYLRSKSLEDPEFTQYLAGELFAGFVSLPQP